MSNREDQSLDFPTADHLRRWKDQLDLLVAEETEMKARHAAEEKALRTKRTRLDKLIAAASAYVEIADGPEPETDTERSVEKSEPPPPTKAPPAKRRRRSKSKTWTATIFKIIKDAGRGMTHSEVKVEVYKTHLSETLKRTEKAFYGGIGKLAEQGKIIKYHGRLYTPTAYHQFMEDVAAGHVEDIPARSAGGVESPNETAVERFLSNRPNGATAAEIVDTLLNNPPPDLAVTKNKTSIYNLLSRQRKSGKLIRRGDRYYLPRQKSEAPNSSEPSASHSHDGGTGNPSSSGNGTLATSHAFPGAIPAHPGE